MTARKLCPRITPRRPLDDHRPRGYLESDRDYVLNNIGAAVFLLDKAVEESKRHTPNAQGDRVILRRWKNKPHGVIAFLPDVPANDWRIMSYEHVGQHGEADITVMHTRTYACKVEDQDAKDMLAELRSLGYHPRVVKRIAAKGTNK